MPSYRSTRIIIEVTFEALPQSLLQLSLAAQGDSGVPTMLLLQSLTISVCARAPTCTHVYHICCDTGHKAVCPVSTATITISVTMRLLLNPNQT